MAALKFQLHEIMDQDHLSILQEQFSTIKSEKGIYGEFTLEEFKEVMNLYVTPNISQTELEAIFTRLDFENVGIANWNSFLLYLHGEKEAKSRTVLLGPSIEVAVSETFQIIRTNVHEDIICKIDLMPVNTEPEFPNARYVTISREGALALWSPSWKLNKHRNINEPMPMFRNVKFLLIDMVSLPNVELIGITCSDNCIRFFDSQSLDCLFILEGFSATIMTISYWFNSSDPSFAMLLLGDTAGSVIAMHFTDCLVTRAFGPNPNKNKIQSVTMQEIMAGAKSFISVVKYKNLHGDWVKQVRFDPYLKCIMSCSNYSQRSLMLIKIGILPREDWAFDIPRGVNCFDYNPVCNLVATGGIDRLVRLWNPRITSKPVVSFVGHGSPVNYMFVTNFKVFSISSDKILKVWDTVEEKCIQNFPLVHIPIGTAPISSACHNPYKHLLLVAINNIVSIKLLTEDRDVDVFASHPTPITGIVYSKLYNQVVSVCQYGLITSWDLDTGNCVLQIQRAHFIIENGEEVPTGISAVCLDDTGKRLFTCGLDGYLKIWNLGSGCTLIHTIRIPEKQNILTVIVINDFIYFGGWSKRIYCGELTHDGIKMHKIWKIHHTDDIISLTHFQNECLISCSWDGKMCAWQFNGSLIQSINLYHYLSQRAEIPMLPASGAISRMSVRTKSSISLTSAKSQSSLPKIVAESKIKATKSMASLKTKPKRVRSYSVDEPEIICPLVRVLCLQTRPVKPRIGNLLAADVMGRIQVWSTTSPSNALAVFASVTLEQQYTTCMVTDSQNKFLITGDTRGFLRIWYIRYFCSGVFLLKGQMTQTPEINKFPFCRKKLRMVANKAQQQLKRFTPYELADDLDVNPPELLSCYQAHLQAIGEIVFVENKEIIITSSGDKSVRLWTLYGRFIGMFGDPKGWNLIDLLTPPIKSRDRKIPSDVRRVSSATTLQVLFSGLSVRWWKVREEFLVNYMRAILKRKAKRKLKEEKKRVTTPQLAARRMSRKIISNTRYGLPLGIHYKLPKKSTPTPKSISSEEMRKTLQVVHKYVPCHELEEISLANAHHIVSVLTAKRRKSRSSSFSTVSKGLSGLSDGK